jgi:hypothetical protein
MLASIDSYRFHPLPAKAGILAESATGNRRAVPGALGSMQPVPATARRFVVHPADPVHIHCARGALRALAVGSPRRRRDAGAGRLYCERGRGDRYDGMPPYRETRNDVRTVRNTHRWLSRRVERLARETRR